MIRTKLRIEDGRLIAVARNGRKFGLPTNRLLQYAVIFRKAGNTESLKAAQRTIADHAAHRVGR